MTLGIATQSRIDEIVAQWVREGKMFTAFEVSLEVKKRGGQERHRNMREYVHETIFRLGIERGDYSRTLMDVGAPEQAWVYHTIASNPYDYVPLDRTGPQTGLFGGRFNPIHQMLATGTDALAGQQDWNKLRYADDTLMLCVQGATHWDSLGHIFYEDKAYNGHSPKLVDDLAATTRVFPAAATPR